MAETARWYVVHTYSGYENTVKATIEKTVQSRNLQEQILAIAIPMETVTKNGGESFMLIGKIGE